MLSCFGGATPATPAYYYSSSSSSGRPWRWWRARCAGVAAAVGSRLRRSLSLKRRTGMGIHACRRRRRTPLSSPSPVHAQQQSAWCHRHHRSFATPVYVDDLYAHHQYRHPQPAKKAVDAGYVVQEPEPEPSTSGGGKLAALAAGASAATTTRAAPATAKGATTATTAGAMRRNVLPRSPGGVLGVVKGMGEVDLRAELFIRKFKEDMRLQSQRSAEEFKAMLARGL